VFRTLYQRAPLADVSTEALEAWLWLHLADPGTFGDGDTLPARYYTRAVGREVAQLRRRNPPLDEVRDELDRRHARG
jgi:hypothetical protein